MPADECEEYYDEGVHLDYLLCSPALSDEGGLLAAMDKAKDVSEFERAAEYALMWEAKTGKRITQGVKELLTEFVDLVNKRRPSPKNYGQEVWYVNVFQLRSPDDCSLEQLEAAIVLAVDVFQTDEAIKYACIWETRTETEATEAVFIEMWKMFLAVYKGHLNHDASYATRFSANFKDAKLKDRIA